MVISDRSIQKPALTSGIIALHSAMIEELIKEATHGKIFPFEKGLKERRIIPIIDKIIIP